jgi:NADPH-dependent glutamate synthase beta subunit-like oxidoreductase
MDTSVARFSVTAPDERYWQDNINCQSACPVHTDARGYVRAIAQGRFEDAYLIARAPNPLASICGRICAAPCEAACRRGEVDTPIAIRALKRFAQESYASRHSDASALDLLAHIRNYAQQRENLRTDEITAYGEDMRRHGTPVAIVGSGPAGLACAHDLALLGFAPTIFEMESVKGGMLAVGIPDYRLPREIIAEEIRVVETLGVEIQTGIQIGVDRTLEDLRRDFKAVVIAVGAKQSRRVPVPGSDHPDVIGGVEFLRAVSLEESVSLGERVVVIGGGSVAYDVGRSALRHEPLDVSQLARRNTGTRSVYLCCLESLDQMPADVREILEGAEEGIERVNSVGPREVIIRDGRVAGVRFQRCVSLFDEQGRFAPTFDESDITEIPCDTVVMAIGQQVDLSFVDPNRDGVSLNARGLVDSQPDGSTQWPWLYLAGDCAYGTRLAIDAVAHGKRVARTIADKLQAIGIAPALEISHLELTEYAREEAYEQIQRSHIPLLDPEVRLHVGRPEVELALTQDQAATEASRCLDCGVNTIFNGEVCVLCGGCVDVCPELCLKIVAVGEMALANGFSPSEHGFDDSDYAIIKDETACIRCACCADRCPVGAVTMERVTFCEVGT